MSHKKIQDTFRQKDYWYPGSDDERVVDRVNAIAMYEGRGGEKLLVYDDMSSVVSDQGYEMRLWRGSEYEDWRFRSSDGLIDKIDELTCLLESYTEPEMPWGSTESFADD